jgi:mevalonate kinase
MSVFVPGKVLLSGEHAVVYGQPALAASIDLGISVTCETPRVKSNNAGLIQKAIELAGGDPHTISIHIDSNLPIGSGLGSSAALSAAVIKAVTNLNNKSISQDELFDLTFKCENSMFGNSSGVDPAAVVYRGLIWYIRNQPIARFTIKNPLHLVLINSGKPEELTGEVVAQVAAGYKNGNKEIIEKIGVCTQKIKIALESGDDITELVNENGSLLERLGVVGSLGMAISKELRAIGCGVKVTGAGGVEGGSGMIMVYHTDLLSLKSYLAQKKLDYIQVTIGE